MTFTQAFRPALNKEGLSRLTFLGHGIKEGVKKDKDTKEEKPWKLFELKFEVMGAVRGTSKEIGLSTNFQYDADNLLGKALAGMGYEPPALTTEEDEEGFEVVAVETDDDGFSVEDEVDLGIEDFLIEAVGNVYIAKLYKPTDGTKKGFWQIDVESLKLFKTKNQ
jgi:hypothetical protein